MVLPEDGPPGIQICCVRGLGRGQRRGEAAAPAVVPEPAAAAAAASSLFSFVVVFFLLVGTVPVVGEDRRDIDNGGEAEADLIKGGPFEVCFFWILIFRKKK